MTIDSARKFFVLASQNPDWVQKLNTANSKAQLEEMLANDGLVFSYHDLDEAYGNILTKCQFPAQAESLQQIRNWYDMLLDALAE